jgi:nitroreductase
VKSAISELVRERYSCRSYVDRPIGETERQALAEFMGSLTTGPFGSRVRFALVAATGEDRAALKGLGTYGFIKDAPGFLVGTVGQAPKNLEDYGYALERAVLAATDLGLQTCWLGGTFNKSTFARKVGATRDETVPAVAAVGYPAEQSRDTKMRQRVGAPYRLPAEQLFFDGEFGRPLELPATGAGANPGTATSSEAAAYAAALEALRWAPSASNKQPWRVLRHGGVWHFFLQRSKGYGKGTGAFRLLRIADLQRVDMGIGMCHFDLVARENGLRGSWVVDPPAAAETGESDRPGLEYSATWLPAGE